MSGATRAPIAGRSQASPLRFRHDGRFVIAQLTDLHLGASRLADARTRALIDAVLERERPDLVALTGDILEGSRAHDPAAALRRGLAPIIERRLAWAPVLGNHDDEGRLDRRGVFALMRRLPGCLGRPGRASGVGNYTLRLLSSRGRQPAARLHFFDSHAYAPNRMGTYAWIRSDQIAWYRRGAARANGDGVPALAFLHIPLPEWDAAWREGWQRRGRRQEAVCSPAVNSGLFSAFVEHGDMVGVFCGHDHLNDYEATLHGLRLVYGRCTGFGGYGRQGFPRGARIIELREAVRDFRTWVVTADELTASAARSLGGAARPAAPAGSSRAARARRLRPPSRRR